MPDGLPGAVKLSADCIGVKPIDPHNEKESLRRFRLLAGMKLEIICAGSEQDGAYPGEFLCRDTKGNHWLIARDDLQSQAADLSSSTV